MFFGLILFLMLPEPPVSAVWSNHFEDRTMRVDYFHSGNASEEHISPDRIVSDGPWSGPMGNAIDSIGQGLYRFEVHGETLLFSRGFSSIFGEWQTTGEAKQRWGTFHESVRFPWPKHPVRLILKKRAGKNFATIWEQKIDPNGTQCVKADLTTGFTAFDILNHGDPKTKVDLLILGDGYTRDETQKFRDDATRLSEALFEEEPFRTRRSDFNVRAIATPANESGVSRPRAGIFRRSPLSTHYNSFGSQRYVLSYDNRRIRDIAAGVPYEFMVILLNEQTYGGGGIFRLMATAAAGSKDAAYLFVHEFGHHFASLGDEYYTSQVSYELEEEISEPPEPNLTALKGPLKWADLVTPGTPLPTPWPKEEYEEMVNKIQAERASLRQANAPKGPWTPCSRDKRTQRWGSFPNRNTPGR